MNIRNYHGDELRHEHNMNLSHETVIEPNFIEMCGYLIQV